MPNFISKEGVWEPAQERVILPDAPRGKEIYEGPDRAAVAMIEESGGSMGQHYSQDTELIMRARQMNYPNVDEYLKAFGYDKEKAAKAYEAVKVKVVDHKPLPAKTVAQIDGGGMDTSGGGNSRIGGFYHPADAPGGKAA